MKGGLYIPPNPDRHLGLGHRVVASMKGGLYIPPNQAVPDEQYRQIVLQ